MNGWIDGGTHEPLNALADSLLKIRHFRSGKYWETVSRSFGTAYLLFCSRSKTSKDQRPERRQRMVRLRFLGATDWLLPEFPTEIMLIK